MSIFRIAYVSVSPKFATDETIQDILKSSRRNNPAYGITGMLLYRDPFFLQYLEGDKDQVLKLIAKIRKDKRHIEMDILAEGTVEKRQFADWSMAFSQNDDIEIDWVNEVLGIRRLSEVEDHDKFINAVVAKMTELVESFENQKNGKQSTESA